MGAGIKFLNDLIAGAAAHLANFAPPAIGSSSSTGTSSDVAHGDHTHAHGTQAGGSLHAAATTSAAGFLSVADKVKLDASLASLAVVAPLTTTGGTSPTLGITAATTSAPGSMSASDKGVLDDLNTIPVQSPLVLPLVVDHDFEATLDMGGIATAVVAVAGSGHKNGKTATIYLPPSSAGGLIVAKDLRVSGDGTIDENGVVTDFDPESGYMLYVSRSRGRFASVLRNVGTADTTAPTVVSATVTSGAPSSLEVVFSKPVYLPSLVGLSLSFSAGTARTITALDSGDGTTTLTFALSGAMSGTDVATFTIGSLRTLQDMNGNPAATSTTSITLSGFGLAQYGFTHEWRADAGVIGSPVSGLNDQIGAFHLSQASGSLQPAFVAGPPAYLDCDGANDKVSSESGSGTNPADVTDHCVVAHFDCSSPNAGVNTVIGFGNQANYGGIEIGYYGSGGQAIVRWTNDAGTPYQIVQTIAAGRLTVIGKLTGGNIYLSVNGGAFSAGTAVSGSVGSTQTYVSIGQCNNKANTAKVKFYHAGLGPSAGINNTAAAAIHSLLTSLHT